MNTGDLVLVDGRPYRIKCANLTPGHGLDPEVQVENLETGRTVWIRAQDCDKIMDGEKYPYDWR